MSENMNSKPTTITAAEFVEQGYAAKIANEDCEIKDGNSIVFDVEQYSPSDRKFWVQLDNNESYHVQGTHTFAVRWLADTAPQAANDSAAEWGPVQTWRWGTDEGWIDTDDYETLKAQRDELKRQLAAAWESIAEARKYIAQLFDPEQRFDMEKGKRFTTETLNFSDSALANAQDVVGGKVAPPAPDVSERLCEYCGKPMSITNWHQVRFNGANYVECIIHKPAPDVSALLAAMQPFVKIWKSYKFWTQNNPVDFADYLYTLPDVEGIFEQLAEAAALKAGE